MSNAPPSYNESKTHQPPIGEVVPRKPATAVLSPLPLPQPQPQPDVGGNPRGFVVYSFVPIYPFKGDGADILAPLGNTLTETLQIAHQSFPQLSTLPISKLDVLIPIALTDPETNQTFSRWTIVPDESTYSSVILSTNPPSNVRVQVKDSQADIEARHVYLTQERERARCSKFNYFFLGIAAIVLVIVLPVYFTSR